MDDRWPKKWPNDRRFFFFLFQFSFTFFYFSFYFWVLFPINVFRNVLMLRSYFSLRATYNFVFYFTVFLQNAMIYVVCWRWWSIYLKFVWKGWGNFFTIISSCIINQQFTIAVYEYCSNFIWCSPRGRNYNNVNHISINKCWLSHGVCKEAKERKTNVKICSTRLLLFPKIYSFTFYFLNFKFQIQIVGVIFKKKKEKEILDSHVKKEKRKHCTMNCVNNWLQNFKSEK